MIFLNEGSLKNDSKGHGTHLSRPQNMAKYDWQFEFLDKTHVIFF